MSDASHMTAEQFLDELQEGERWIELSEGRLIWLDPPDVAHGNVVQNVSRALAVQIRARPEIVACFELGLVLNRGPDTVFCPAISCFRLPEGFQESDKLITETVPKLVVEIASTNDRRANLNHRVQAYLNRGVSSVWVVDPVDRQVHLFQQSAAARRFHEHETLRDPQVVPGFELRVADVFADPKWWSARSTSS